MTKLPIDRVYRRWRIKIFVLTWIAYAGFYLCRKNLAVVKADLKGELGFDNISLGAIDTAFLVMYAVGQFANGLLGDKLGSKITVGAGLLIAAAGNFTFGFGTTLGFLMVLYGINGYAQATGWPGLVKTMANWFSTRERGIVMGWWSTCYQLGSAGATAFAAALLGAWGWRYAFFVPATLLGGIGLVFLLGQRNRPEDLGLPGIQVYHGIASAADEAATDRLPLRAVWGEVLGHATVWLMGISYFCLKLVRYALMFWLPLYMVEQLGYKPVQAGFHSVILELAGFLGAIGAGYCSDKLFQSRRGPVCALMFAGMAIALLAYTRLALMGPGWNLFGMALIGLMMYGPDSLMTGAGAMDFGTKRGAATAAGFINGLGSIGAACQGFIVGYYSQWFGWTALFYLFVGCAVCGALVMATRWNTRAPTAIKGEGEAVPSRV